MLQAIVCGTTREAWEADPHGLRPRDIAMQIALPEIDGRIITRAISFKGMARRCDLTEADLSHYEPDLERIEHLAELTRRWCRLRQLPAADKRLALVLANYPGSEGRIGSGVGLDTPAAVIRLLALLGDEGHDLGDALPCDGDALMRALCAGIANDPEQWPLRPAFQSLSMAAYRRGLATLPTALVEAIGELRPLAAALERTIAAYRRDPQAVTDKERALLGVTTLVADGTLTVGQAYFVTAELVQSFGIDDRDLYDAVRHRLYGEAAQPPSDGGGGVG